MRHADSEKFRFQDSWRAEVASAICVGVDCRLDRRATACEGSGNAQIPTWFEGSRGVPAFVFAWSRRLLGGLFRVVLRPSFCGHVASVIQGELHVESETSPVGRSPGGNGRRV